MYVLTITRIGPIAREELRRHGGRDCESKKTARGRQHVVQGVSKKNRREENHEGGCSGDGEAGDGLPGWNFEMDGAPALSTIFPLPPYLVQVDRLRCGCLSVPSKRRPLNRASELTSLTCPSSSEFQLQVSLETPAFIARNCSRAWWHGSFRERLVGQLCGLACGRLSQLDAHLIVALCPSVGISCPASLRTWLVPWLWFGGFFNRG